MANLREVAAAVEARGKPKLARATVLLPLPLYDGAYAARFGVLNADRLSEFEEVANSGAGMEPDAEMAFTAGFVSDACRQIHAVSTPSLSKSPAIAAVMEMSELRGPEALTHDDGRPVLFDEEFADALGLKPPGEQSEFTSGADVVLACWTVEDDDGERAVNVAALSGFANRLFDWMQDTSKRVQGELVGESQGTRP